MRTRVKICCIRSIDEAQMAVRAGADAIGLVGPMPSGPRQISDDLVQEIAAAVPPAISTFLLTSRTRAEDIVDHVRYCGVNTVQIVQHLDPAEAEKLARLLPPSIRRVQVLHVNGTETLKLVAAYTPYVHAFLLDSGRPNLPEAEFGGTGRVHDWGISAQLVRQSVRPVFLAGGLSPENVAEAINTVRPHGVDVCSGLRPHRALDEERLRLYFQAIRGAEAGYETKRIVHTIL